MTPRRFAVPFLCALLLTGVAFAQTASRASQPAAYVLGPQDLLKITVFDEPGLSGSFRIDGDGGFQYPMLGRVVATGKSVRDIEAQLAKQLEAGFVRTAQVTVELEQYRVRNIFVIGEVRSPGKIPMQGRMSVLEAMALAGGTTQTAGPELIILRPASPSQEAAEVSGVAQAQRINLSELQLGRLANNVILEEGDTVYVPKAERFFITGHVKSPGPYVWEPNLTVLQALSLAGGLTDKGSNRRLKVLRIVDGKKDEDGIDLTDFVKPGDTLIVPQRLL